MTTLNQLKPGDACSVISVVGKGGIHQRLLEMGVIQGARVEVVRFAPLGDPMQIFINGYHLLLRKSEAALVQVTSNDDALVAAGV